jgi:hypothetical protein
MPFTVGTRARIISSWRMNSSMADRPAPPYSTGQCGAIQPRSASAAAHARAPSRRAGSGLPRSTGQL